MNREEYFEIKEEDGNFRASYSSKDNLIVVMKKSSYMALAVNMDEAASVYKLLGSIFKEVGKDT